MKKEVDKVVKKVIDEYGETLRMLGDNENKTIKLINKIFPYALAVFILELVLIFVVVIIYNLY